MAESSVRAAAMLMAFARAMSDASGVGLTGSTFDSQFVKLKVLLIE